MARSTLTVILGCYHLGIPAHCPSLLCWVPSNLNPNTVAPSSPSSTASAAVAQALLSGSQSSNVGLMQICSDETL